MASFARTLQKGEQVQVDRWNCRVEKHIGTGGHAMVYRCSGSGVTSPLVLRQFDPADTTLSDHAPLAFTVWQRVRDQLVAAGLPDILWRDSHHELSELVPGENILSLANRLKGLSLPQVHALILSTSEKVGHLMRANVVHGDIKNNNIMASCKGRDSLPTAVQLIDFDLLYDAADLKHLNGFTVGSPQYMAPEQACGSFRPTTDVFALGITTLDLLSRMRKLPLKWDEVATDRHLGAVPLMQKRANGTWLLPNARQNMERQLLQRTDTDLRPARQLIEFFFAATRQNWEVRPRSFEEMRQLLADKGNLTEI